MASSAQEQQRLPTAAGLQNLMAMALGSFRREDLGYNNSNNDRDDHRMPPRYSTNRASAHRDVQVVRTKRGAPTAAATADHKKGTMVQALHQELPLHLNNNNNTAQQQQRETLRYQPPRTIDFHHISSTNSLSGNGTVTSEITMLNLDFLGEEDSDDQTVQTTNTNDYDGMDQMQQTMNEMLTLAKKSTGSGGGMLDASHKSSGSLHSLGNVSFGVSSVLNHKERLYGSKRNVTEDQQQVVMGAGKMNGGEFVLKRPSSVTPLHLKNENNGIAHLQQGLPPSLPPRLSSSPNNHPQHRPTITTSNTSNSSNGDDQEEEYSAGEIDAIIALKLEVANQRTIIDELSSKLNRALGEKKELEEKMVMSSSMNSRSSHWRRLNRDHDGEQQPSIDEEPNVLSSSLRQLSMSYKTATSTIFSSFSVANPLKEEITPPPPSKTTATTAQSSLQQQTSSSPISTSWSQAKSGNTTLISTPSQQQQRSQSLTIPNNNNNSKIKLQLLELQTTLATQMESSKRKEREWMSLCEKLQSENQRLSDENRQWKKNSVGSCSNLSGLSRLSGRNGASGSSSGGGGSIRSLQSSDFSSRKGRITEGVPLREEKKQDSVAECKEEEEDDDECSSTQNSTGDQESWKKPMEVEPIFVRTKI
ncbi:hypothetical protein QTG54_016731 [Skeletonema marinoi]|uniref:Uncharacterized protein n=1 Tax=Skeletonema marinoi TaxID=267567 RepID=A0AAD8XSC9_9STRA|nr:hypothetical protein QTG54_016731 [Skeletonema marinoi]